MPSQEKPKKPRLKSINLSKKQSWRKIIREVEKKEVPIHVLEKLIVNLKDGTSVPIDIKELLNTGIDPDVVEKELNAKLQDLELYIHNVDFYIDLDKIEETIQTETDKILSILKL